jgi:hypothetical protein
MIAVAAIQAKPTFRDFAPSWRYASRPLISRGWQKLNPVNASRVGTGVKRDQSGPCDGEHQAPSSVSRCLFPVHPDSWVKILRQKSEIQAVEIIDSQNFATSSKQKFIEPQKNAQAERAAGFLGTELGTIWDAAFRSPLGLKEEYDCF